MDIIFCSSGLHLHLIWNWSDEEASWWIDAPRKRGKTKPFPTIIIATSHSTNWHFKWMYRGLYGITSYRSSIYQQAPITTLSFKSMGQSRQFFLIDQMCTVVIDGRHQLAPEDHIGSWWLEGSIHKKIINNNMSRWSIDVGLLQSIILSLSKSQFWRPRGHHQLPACWPRWIWRTPLCINRFAHPSSLVLKQEETFFWDTWGSHIFPSRLYPVFY